MKHFYKIAVYAVVLAAMLAGCNDNKEKCKTTPFKPVALPSYIYDNTQALKFLSGHFWDNFVNTSKRCLNSVSSIGGTDSISFCNAFVEYANILTACSAPDAELSVNKLVKNLDSLAGIGVRKPLLQVITLAEQIFYDPNSPLLNEEIYLDFLNGIMAAQSLDSLEKMQYSWQHQICMLNRTGTQAADFSFRELTASGTFTDHRLYGIKGEYTLIFFNNPDCNSCSGILEAIIASPLAAAVKQGKLKILAMYIDEDLTAWHNNRSKYPKEWIYAHDPELVLRDNNIYGLRAIPSLYLLDKDKKVILKDAPVGKVIEYMTF